MARRFRPLDSAASALLPGRCAACAFWESPERLPLECGARCDTERVSSWVRTIEESWGSCGRVVVDDGVPLGFVKYAPASAVPQARNMPSGPPDEAAVLVCCMHIVPEARQRGLGKVLMQAALRDLYQRGERVVQAYAAAGRVDYATSPVVGVEFLLRMGFTAVRPHPEVPLMQLELKSLAAWAENLEAALEALRIPLRMPERRPVPTPCQTLASEKGLR
ncbi:MAG: GNAT family N-acetyltransferase [Anaerosomatales bacterium]|nr:GNAT family N-acetyltransferase [Anaerosomatales bacterium]MDI6843240.1 GNAT family N-acetyltransferase [Anaerosomatales bacterium]